MPARVVTFRGFTASFRTPGVAAGDTPLFTVFNTTGSGVLVAVRRLVVQHEFPALTAVARTNSITRVTTAPTGGTLLTPVTFDTTQTHVASVELRCASSADGTASAITSPVGAALGYRDWVAKDPTAVGRRLYPDYTLVPLEPETDDPVVLREGEGLRVGETESGNANSNFLHMCMFEEFTYAAASAFMPGRFNPALQAVKRAGTF